MIIKMKNTKSINKSANTPFPPSSPIVAQLRPSRSPSFVTAKSRKRVQSENFFKGKAHATYRLPQHSMEVCRAQTHCSLKWKLLK